MTKPEGPAPEPQCTCDKERDMHGDLYEPCAFCQANYVPATPAPSQPAGARPRDLRKRGDDYKAAWELAEAELEALAEQTAAKDAEIAGLNANLSCLRDQTRQDGEQMVRLRRELNEMQDLLAQWRPRAEAAERERNSLREEKARLAADLDVALKAGKETKL